MSPYSQLCWKREKAYSIVNAKKKKKRKKYRLGTYYVPHCSGQVNKGRAEEMAFAMRSRGQGVIWARKAGNL